LQRTERRNQKPNKASIINPNSKSKLKIIDVHAKYFDTVFTNLTFIDNISKCDPSNDCWFMVGFVEDNQRIMNHKNEIVFYQYSFLSTQHKHLLGPFRKNYGESIHKEGSILEVVLNLNDLTISFIINGKDYGIAYSNIEKKHYRIAVCVYYTGLEFEFL